MPGCKSEDVRFAPTGNIYVPTKWPYIPPTDAVSEIDASLEPLGYLTEKVRFEAAPYTNGGVRSDRLRVWFGAAQISTRFFELLFRPYSMFVIEWDDDEGDRYRFVMQRGELTRSLDLLRKDAMIVNVECLVKQWAMYTECSSVDTKNLYGTYK